MRMATASPLDHDPVRAACLRAPTVKRLTADQRAELDQAMEDIQAGRSRLVPSEDVPAALEEIALGRGA
jgi:hypothetical protein